MEYVILFAIVALWVLGSMIPTGHSWTRQRVYATYTKHASPWRRVYSAYSTGEIRIVSRFCARWRVERLSLNTDALTQYFEGFNDAASN